MTDSHSALDVHGTHDATPEWVAAYARCLGSPFGPDVAAPLGYAYVPAFPVLYEAARAVGGDVFGGASVHAGYDVTWHTPLLAPASLTTQVTATDVRQSPSGTFVAVSATTATTSGELVWSHTSTLFGRRGPARSGSGQDRAIAPADGTAAVAWPRIPLRPDLAIDYDAASGDHNAIHTDPSVAMAMGFDEPILQGSCIFALVAQHCADLAETGGAHVVRLSLRFRAPVPVRGALAVGLAAGASTGVQAVAVRHDLDDDAEPALVVDGRLTFGDGRTNAD